MNGEKPIRVGQLWKSCTECEAVLPLENFHSNKSSPDGRHSRCRICKNNASKARYELNKEGVLLNQKQKYASARERHLKTKYGMTCTQYNQLLEKQDYSCAVCKKHSDDETKSLHVDHDHVTGEIRGLLCNFCNRQVIGRLRNADIFENAAKYLRQGTGWFVPKQKRPVKRKKGL